MHMYIDSFLCLGIYIYVYLNKMINKNKIDLTYQVYGEKQVQLRIVKVENMAYQYRKLNLYRIDISQALLALILILNTERPVIGHGTMIDPVSRNSLWRVDSSAPVNYNDIELFCGGIGEITKTGKCGVCGDPYSMKKPRPHETGGRFATNQTVRTYFPGSTIDVIIDLKTSHGGYMKFDLCRRNSYSTLESEECFEELLFEDGSKRKYLRNDHSDTGLKSYSLLIPRDLISCPYCILRWDYKAGNTWYPKGKEGPQELYRNCADIAIGRVGFGAR